MTRCGITHVGCTRGRSRNLGSQRFSLSAHQKMSPAARTWQRKLPTHETLTYACILADSLVSGKRAYRGRMECASQTAVSWLVEWSTR